MAPSTKGWASAGRIAIVFALSFAGVVRPPGVMDRTARASIRPPNVLIILTDDQRARGTLGVMPSVRRWFGAGGTRFPKAFASTPLCCPSRASIFSGRDAHNHTVQSNQRGAEDAFDQTTTIQAYLQAAGYDTAIVGKYFNAWDLSVPPPSFDHWAIDSPNGPTGYAGGTWSVDGRLRTVDAYSTTFIARRGLAYLRARESTDDQPWFLELATFGPHAPSIPSSRYADTPVPPLRLDPSMTESDLSDKPEFVRDRKRPTLYHLRAVHASELRCLMSVDDLVARVMRTLRAEGELGNTLAFFLSDNGSLLGAHRMTGKQTPYTPSIQLPFFARWPGHLGAGAVDHRFAENIDVAPTVLDAAGIEQDADVPMDGRSLLDDSWTRRRVLTEYWQLKHPSDVPTWASFRTHREQYVEYYDDAGAVTFREYYDLRRDPWELTNLLHDGTSGDDPDVAALHRTLAGDRTCVGTACP